MTGGIASKHDLIKSLISQKGWKPLNVFNQLTLDFIFPFLFWLFSSSSFLNSRIEFELIGISVSDGGTNCVGCHLWFRMISSLDLYRKPGTAQLERRKINTWKRESYVDPPPGEIRRWADVNHASMNFGEHGRDKSSGLRSMRVTWVFLLDPASIVHLDWWQLNT